MLFSRHSRDLRSAYPNPNPVNPTAASAEDGSVAVPLVMAVRDLRRGSIFSTAYSVVWKETLVCWLLVVSYCSVMGLPSTSTSSVVVADQATPKENIPEYSFGLNVYIVSVIRKKYVQGRRS